jgi:hypothetical protein
MVFFIPDSRMRLSGMRAGFLNFLTKIPGEIRLQESISRRAGKLALWEIHLYRQSRHG